MALSLKVTFGTSGLQKTMRFTMDMSVGEALKLIQEKTSEGGTDHGLVQKEKKEKQQPARWMKENKLLQFYGLENGVGFRPNQNLISFLSLPWHNFRVLLFYRMKWSTRKSMLR
jgi:hypothetical protein